MLNRGILTKGILIALALTLIPVAAVSAQKVVPGSTCKVLDKKVIQQGKTFICIKSGKKLLWNKGVAVKKPVANPTQAPVKPTPAPIKNITYLPPSVVSDDIETCKIKEVSKSRGFTGAGFPEWKTLTPSTGTVKWALLPIDFADLPGEKNFRSRIDDQMRLLSEWYFIVSEGKFKVEWVVADNWVRLPGVTSDYVIPLSVNLNNAPNGPKFFNAAMDAADPTFDFTNVQTVNFILPQGQTFIGEGTQGFPWDQAVKDYVSKEGRIFDSRPIL